MTVALCGTRSGYMRHLDRHEPPCEDCREASARDAREYRRMKRSGRGAVGRRRGGPLPPPPASFARCRRQCGRLVWHFDRGLCGTCGRAGSAVA